tara:strand:+ start:641 stop:859 length:219 start_codon:yes stop_codon:yes gene_type:complete
LLTGLPAALPATVAEPMVLIASDQLPILKTTYPGWRLYGFDVAGYSLGELLLVTRNGVAVQPALDLPGSHTR